MSVPVTNDALSFYVCTTASFLESPVATYVDNLEPMFADDPLTCKWLRQTWLPEETEHGQILGAYVQRTWPEFDWQHAFASFSARYLPQCTYALLRPTPGLEALARCVTETAATMTYRCMSVYTKDPELRALMRRLSSDEVRHYRYFRRLHLVCNDREEIGFLQRARTVLGRSELVRDEDLFMAYEPINTAWRSRPPFQLWSYEEFRRASAAIVRAHLPMREAKRMMLSPLKSESLLARLALLALGALVTRYYLADA